MLMRQLFVVAIGCILILPAIAKAEKLNADKTQELLSQAPWQIQTGGEINYFLWNPDGTLCVKMYEPNAESCDDSGTWTRDGTNVCYKLPWWGKGVDLHELCFHVVRTDSSHYEAIDKVGLPALRFTVPESN